MLIVAPDRFTVFCCDGTLGFLVVAGAIYFLLRVFRRDQDKGDGKRDDDEPF
jgi:hypothetical protein